MSYTMPGMAHYGLVGDAPSGVTDLPIVQQSAAIGLGSPAASANVSYSGSFNVTTALVVFAILYFGTVGTLHYLSRADGRV